MIYIQILRGLAAALVVVFHSITIAHRHISGDESPLLHVFAYGDCGVDIFFVISGFIIYQSTHASHVNPAAFLIRRAKRIVPIYWLCTAMFMGIYFAFPSALNGAVIESRHVVESLFFCSFLDGRSPIIYVGWSLEYEMFFYLVVALLLHRSEEAWNRLTLVFSILVLLRLVSVGQSIEPVHAFLTNPRILEFVYGVVAAQLFKHARVSVGAIAGVAIATFAIAMTETRSYVLLFGLPSAFLVYAAAKLSARTRDVGWIERLLARAGGASYSIYLFQVFSISALIKIMMRLDLGFDVVVLATSSLSIVAGYLFYQLVEQPLLNFLRPLGAGGGSRPAASPCQATGLPPASSA